MAGSAGGTAGLGLDRERSAIFLVDNYLMYDKTEETLTKELQNGFRSICSFKTEAR